MPTTSIQPEASSAPTSHSGRKPPTSDAMSAAVPTTDMNRMIVTAASAASAIRDLYPELDPPAATRPPRRDGRPNDRGFRHGRGAG